MIIHLSLFFSPYGKIRIAEFGLLTMDRPDWVYLYYTVGRCAVISPYLQSESKATCTDYIFHHTYNLNRRLHVQTIYFAVTCFQVDERKSQIHLKLTALLELKARLLNSRPPLQFTDFQNNS